MRYNKRSLDNLVKTLHEWHEQSTESLSNAEDTDYPNDERIDSLTTRVDSIETAIDALEEIE